MGRDRRVVREVIGWSDSTGTAASHSGFAKWEFPAEAESLSPARARVRDVPAQGELTGLGDMTVSLVNELLTNAPRHTDGPVRRRVYGRGAPAERAHGPADRRGDVGARRATRPGDARRPAGRPGEDEHGRGPRLVARLSGRWGTPHVETGKAVWFELPLPG